MERRELLGVLGAGAAGLVAMRAGAAAEEPGRFQYRSRLDKTHIDCLDSCTACAAVCNEASSHCLSQIEKGSTDRAHHSHAHHLTMDCAAMCALAAELVARQSVLMDAQCNACAEACRRCAEECGKDRENTPIMQDCVRLCRECERTCREMIRAMGSRPGAGAAPGTPR
jgi:hypothetical protein